MRLPRRSVIRLAHPSAPLRLLSAFGLCGASGHDVVLASRFVSSVRDPRAVAPAGTQCYEVPDWRLGAMAKIDRGAKVYVAGHRGLVGSAHVRRLKTAGFRNLLMRRATLG